MNHKVIRSITMIKLLLKTVNFSVITKFFKKY